MREGKRKKSGFPYRTAALLGGSLLLVLAFSLVNLRPDLSHLDVRIASGPDEANYNRIVDELAEAARERGGTIRNQPSNGSVDNLERLAKAAEDCELDFALVQDGIEHPANERLELIARLPTSESVFFVAKGGRHVTRFAQLRGMRIGVGPAASGTDHLARQIFEDRDFSSLGLTLVNLPLSDQLLALEQGRIDMAVFVLDEDAALMREVVTRPELELAAFEHLDVIARRFPFLSHGRIAAGQYDPIAVVPAEDRRVLRVDTLVVGNDCASRTQTLGLLSLLHKRIPHLLQHNREQGGSTLFQNSTDAEEYILNNGPGWADLHLPWLVNIMPIGNWFYVVMAISVLFNVMTFWHRLRLWRIDANRHEAQEVFREILGEELTPDEILALEATAEHAKGDNAARIDESLEQLDTLRARCRRYENSMLVPMGQEGAYRYMEEQMEQILTAMRDFRRRMEPLIAEADSGSDSGSGSGSDSDSGSGSGSDSSSDSDSGSEKA